MMKESYMVKTLVAGLITYIPGYSHIPVLSRASYTNTEGTDSACYCYSVWLRHLVMADKNGLSVLPETVAELGPGDSLGIGLAALLSGVKQYYALDVVRYADISRNLAIFDGLVKLFERRAGIPDESQFPEVRPRLQSYRFPAHILTEQRLHESLDQRRVQVIRDSLTLAGHDSEGERRISYFVPWDSGAVLKENSVDMIYSQAVLEHVTDLEHTYRALSQWLKPGGFMSHVIDFRCHGSAARWNGHWTYSDLTWKLMQGTRPYLLNRRPHSDHVNLLAQYGFQAVCDDKTTDTSGIKQTELAPRFWNISEEDLMTNVAFMQAVKSPV